MSKSMFLGGFVCGFIALLFNVISFSSPYWLQSFPRVHSDFVRMGLWEACFNNYVHPQDYNSKAYQGCWWVFSPELRPIWEWLTPPWFISVQVMVTTCMLVQMATVIVTSMQILKCCNPNMSFTIHLVACLLSFLSTLLWGISVLIFGVKSQDRVWMPRPDQNFLSWSFGLAVLSGFFSFFSGLCLLACARDAITKKKKAKAAHGYPLAPKI